MTATVALVTVWAVMAATPRGRSLDLAAYAGRLDAGHQLRLLDATLLNAITGVTAGLGLLTLALVGRWTRRGATAVRGIVAVAGATLSTELLKTVLPHARAADHVWTWAGGGSFPSGHTTIAASMSLAALTVSSTRWRRRLVGPLLAWTVLTGTATIAAGWHRPSDVLGALLMAALWHRLVEETGRPSVSLSGHLPVVRRFTAMIKWSGPGLWWTTATAAVLWGAVRQPIWSETLAEPAAASYLSSLITVAFATAVVFTSSRPLSRRVR